MSLIFYQPLGSKIGERLQRALQAVVSGDLVEELHAIDDLYERLQKPLCPAKVVVIFAATKRDLERILHLRDFLLDKKLVLILPDDNSDMIAEAHTLRPRFITWADSDFKDIESVLKRLITLSADHFKEENFNVF